MEEAPSPAHRGTSLSASSWAESLDPWWSTCRKAASNYSDRVLCDPRMPFVKYHRQMLPSGIFSSLPTSSQ